MNIIPEGRHFFFEDCARVETWKEFRRLVFGMAGEYIIPGYMVLVAEAVDEMREHRDKSYWCIPYPTGIHLVVGLEDCTAFGEFFDAAEAAGNGDPLLTPSRLGCFHVESVDGAWIVSRIYYDVE